ncbi:hypothetical protein MMC26_003663 [Xylographa opegraphella]|nr:hypothetical protein [Xylographa opegraphella]
MREIPPSSYTEDMQPPHAPENCEEYTPEACELYHQHDLAYIKISHKMAERAYKDAAAGLPEAMKAYEDAKKAGRDEVMRSIKEAKEAVTAMIAAGQERAKRLRRKREMVAAAMGRLDTYFDELDELEEL